MYLLDTNVISEMRKGVRANLGVQAFFQQSNANREKVYLSTVTIGELRRGIELIRYRKDFPQAQRLEQWLSIVLHEYQDNIIGIDTDTSQIWGRLRVPHPENALDKLIAATALLYDLTVVTRNVGDFIETNVRALNPFN